MWEQREKERSVKCVPAPDVVSQIVIKVAAVLSAMSSYSVRIKEMN